MPQTAIRVFRDANGTVPIENWLEDLEERSKGPHQQIGHGMTSLSLILMKDTEAKKKEALTAASVLPATAD